MSDQQLESPYGIDRQLFNILYKHKHELKNIATLWFLYLGAYGTVYKARDTVNDTIVAIKKVKLGLTEDGVPMQVTIKYYFSLLIFTGGGGEKWWKIYIPENFRNFQEIDIFIHLGIWLFLLQKEQVWLKLILLFYRSYVRYPY